MKKASTISACLVLYNEEAVIERCLESLKDSVSEIIIVHDGECTDRTLDICRTYTDKIFTQPHCGEAEPHRVFCMHQATGDWILQIDPDEFLSPELAQAIPELLQNDACDGYEMLWPLWDGHKCITKNWPYKPILFRRSTISYLGFPHEPLRATTGRVCRVPLLLEHRPTYNNFTFKRFKKKWLAWARVQAAMQMKPFSEIPQYNITATDWHPRVLFVRDHPYLFPLVGLYTGLATLRDGGWKEGYPGWRQALMWGSYNAAVYYYIMKIPH
jgi:glycosyltransferase involved in cell wall biosynthesis